MILKRHRDDVRRFVWRLVSEHVLSVILDVHRPSSSGVWSRLRPAAPVIFRIRRWDAITVRDADAKPGRPSGSRAVAQRSRPISDVGRTGYLHGGRLHPPKSGLPSELPRVWPVGRPAGPTGRRRVHRSRLGFDPLNHGCSQLVPEEWSRSQSPEFTVGHWSAHVVGKVSASRMKIVGCVCLRSAFDIVVTTAVYY